MHVLSLFCFALFFFFLRVCVCVWLVEKRNSGSSNNRGLCYGLCRSGPVGMAAAAAIVSSKKRKRPHSFETNPSIRKRQHNRLLRKLKVSFWYHNILYLLINFFVIQIPLLFLRLP